MNSKNLIPVFNGQISDSEALLCDARKLHEFLQVGKDYSSWIKSRIEEYKFQENQDFISFRQNGRKPKGGRPATEYHITLDMAKELAMVERNEQGRAARRYFIECEKKLLAQAAAPKALPRTAKRLIRSRDDLSFTCRDSRGRLINWQPPANEYGIVSKAEAYGIGEAWFAEVVQLAYHNKEEAWFALSCAAEQMTGYLGGVYSPYPQTVSQQVSGFFGRMARYTLAGILSTPKGKPVSFPFIDEMGIAPPNGLETYLQHAAPLADAELHWRAWELSAECRYACYRQKLAELSAT